VANVGLEVLAVMKDKNAVFCNVTPFSLVHIYHTALQEVSPRKLEAEAVTK
jgi:hypothetical protein